VIQHGGQHGDAGAIAPEHQRILAAVAVVVTGSKHGAPFSVGERRWWVFLIV
jgi:hypothetical protein